MRPDGGDEEDRRSGFGARPHHDDVTHRGRTVKDRLVQLLVDEVVLASGSHTNIERRRAQNTRMHVIVQIWRNHQSTLRERAVRLTAQRITRACTLTKPRETRRTCLQSHSWNVARDPSVSPLSTGARAVSI